MMSLAKAFLAAFGLVSYTVAFGPAGHTTVAHIAEHYLPADIDFVLRTELGNMSLSDASDWADVYDHTPAGKWSMSLHFINYPGQACDFDWARDCKDDWCSPGAIVNYTKRIFNRSLSKSERVFALKFVIHLVGDIHQPLHVSSGDNEGGNAIKLGGQQFSRNVSQWVSDGLNLHGVWDDDIVIQDIRETDTNATLGVAKWATLGAAKWVPNYQKYWLLAGKLEKRMEGDWSSMKEVWQATVAGCKNEAIFRSALTVVAKETAALGCNYAYKYASGSDVQSGDVLDRDYYLRAQPILEEQIAKGGVRLARILAEALAQSRTDMIRFVV